MIKNFSTDRIIEGVTKFSRLKFIQAMKDGLVVTMPFTIVGSIFLILSSFPYKPIADQITAWGWQPYLSSASGATFNLMAIFAVIGMTKRWVDNEGYDGLPAALLALASFVILLPQQVQVLNGAGKKIAVVTNVIDKNWTGGQGMIGAILISTVVGIVYSWFMKHKFTIKLPDQVPPAIAGAFTAIIPGSAILVGSVFVEVFFNFISKKSLMEAIYSYLQVPLQGITDSFGGLFIFIFLMAGFWSIGIHGPLVVNGLMGPILQANTLDNAKLALQSNAALQAHGHIFIQPLVDQFVNVTGTGMTLGLMIFMLFFAKSKSFKDLAKLELVPTIFNINEPLLFGIPIVLNPIMMVPFILTPLLSGCLTYIVTAIGILPKCAGVQVPWTTPPIISGYLIGGMPYMLWQILMLTMSIVIWFPFARIVDRMNLKRESGEATD